MRKNLAVWIASAFALLAAESQAQLHITVYPSKDDNNKTLWIFKGYTSKIYQAGSLGRISSFEEDRDKLFQMSRYWETHLNYDGDFSEEGKIFREDVRNESIEITPLKTTSRDYRYLDWYREGDVNAPTAIISNNWIPITHVYMHEEGNTEEFTGEGDNDYLGIALREDTRYHPYKPFEWRGSGNVDKPISDFYLGTRTSWEDSAYSFVGEGLLTIDIVPEPEEYAIVFGLFALGFVFFHRRQQKKKRKGWGKI